MPERGARNETLPSNDCSRGAETQTRSAKTLDGSQGTEPNLLQDLEKQIGKPETRMTKPEIMIKSEARKNLGDCLVIRARVSFGLRHSDFVIFSHVTLT